MGTKAGVLLWNRQRIELSDAVETIVDTGITQVNQAFVDEPSLGIVAASPGPAGGAEPPSRVQVIALAPLSAWSFVTFDEPFVDPATGTVKLRFAVAPGSPTINVLFVSPNAGPVEADVYGPMPPPVADCPPAVEGGSEIDFSIGPI